MHYFLSGDLSIFSPPKLETAAAQVALGLGLRPFSPDLEGRWEGDDVLLTTALGLEVMMCHQEEPPPSANEVGVTIMSKLDGIQLDGSERDDDVGTYFQLLLQPVFGDQVVADAPWSGDGVQRVAIRSFLPGDLIIRGHLPFDQMTDIISDRLGIRPFQSKAPGVKAASCLGLDMKAEVTGHDLRLTLTPVGGDLAAPPALRVDAADYVRTLLSSDPSIRVA